MTLFYVGKLETETTSSDSLGVRKYTEYHKIISERTDSPYVLWAHPDIPNHGALHFQDPTCWLQNRSVSKCVRLKHQNIIRLQWTLKMEYSSEFELAENPLNTPVKLWCSGETYQRPLNRNRLGKIIVNKAGTTVRGLVRDDTRPIIHGEKNLPVNGFDFAGVADVINIAPVTLRGEVFPINSLKFKFEGVSEPKQQNGIWYEKAKFSLHYRGNLWKLNHPNEGLYQKVDGIDYPLPCIDSRGAPTTTEMPLLLNGEQATYADITAGLAPIPLEEDVYPEINFTTDLYGILT